MWWILPIGGAVEVAVAAGVGAALRPDHLELYVGIGLGIAIATVLLVLDSPPHHIERWRQGAQGEQATAKALRPLVRAGWTLVHDVDTGRGNLDHILIGPPGVFVLESKKLNGTMSVTSGVLSVRWHEDPTDGYENRRLAGRMRARAAELSAALREQGASGIWVQPVVALWGTYEQRSIESDGVAWVAGGSLADVLAARPAKLSAADVAYSTAALRAWLDNSARIARAA